MRLRFLLLAFIFMFLFSAVSAQNITYTKLMGVREIDGEFQGIAADLIVEVREGTGRVFIETKPLTQVNTQASARLSKEVACRILEMNCSNYDFFYIIESDYQIIGGPSAGAAMTGATIAALHGVDMNQDVFITGTINPAGSIGPVGSILEKAEAAHDSGGRILIVPDGHGIVYLEEIDKEIDIIELARKNWGIEIIESSDIISAYKYLTGYDIIVKVFEPTENTIHVYNMAMRTLSDNLLRQARNSRGRLNYELGNANLSYEKIEEIEILLEQSSEDFKKAENSYARNMFYSSSSFSVRSLISSKYAINKIGYYEEGKSHEYIEKKLSEEAFAIDNFEKFFLRTRRIDDRRDIEVYAVVIDRLREAEDILDSSYSAYEEGDYERALYLLSFAEVKRNTAYDWLTLINIFEGDLSLNFNPNNVKEISQERIQQSKTSITYASTVVNNQILIGAYNHLERAIESYNDGKYVFALFEASKARANANLAMEIRGVTDDTIQRKIDFLEEEAKRAITRAEEQGILPILAMSYLEFGTTLREEEPLQAMVYMSYSREMAQISEDLTEAILDEKVVSRRVHIEKYYEHAIMLDRRTKLAIELVVLLSGAMLGVLVSLYILEGKRF